MTPFFRRIRQKLANDNQFLKYSRYAIGEIILVVIGILIALQINNWNNLQNDRQTEIKYLYQIKNSLEDNGLILKKRVDLDKKILKNGEQLFVHVKEQKVLNDSVKKLFLLLQFDQMISLNMAAFENLKNDGLSFISNDDIKFEIINIYDEKLNYIQNIFANQFENYIDTVINPFFSKNFEFYTKDDKIMVAPNDYQELLKNRELTNIISAVNTMRRFAISNYTRTQQDIQEVLIKIESEIATLEE